MHGKDCRRGQPRSAGGTGRRNRLLLGVALVVGAVMAISSSASAVTFGVNWDGTYGNLDAVAESGATVFHAPLTYSPGGGWEADDHLVEAAWRRGLTILPTLEGNGTKFLTSTSGEWGTWGAWSREAVERYGINGSFWNGKADPTPITAWEIWNEPNMVENNPTASEPTCKSIGQHYYKNIGTCVQPAAYGQFLKYTAEQIQAGSNLKTAHGTEVLFGGLYARSEAEEEEAVIEGGNRGSLAITTFLEGAKEAGPFSSGVTGVALHPYALVGGEAEFEHKIGRIRSWLNTNGLSGQSLWLTELGWPVGGSEHFPTNGHPVSPSEQAGLLHQSFDWLKSNASADNIAFAAWFNIRDYINGASWPGTCGLLDLSGNRRPAWDAFHEETGGPAALGSSPNVLHEGSNWWIFYRGSDGALWQQTLVNGAWVPYRIGGQVAPGTTPAVKYEAGNWWVFYHGADGALHEASLTSGSEWTDYRIGGEMAWSTSPAVKYEAGNWWVFYHGADGALHEASLTSGSEWTDYRIGGDMAWSTSPAAEYESGNWWVFYQGTDGALHEASLTSGSEWTDYRIGGDMAPAATPVVNYAAGNWRVFYRGSDGALWQESLASGGEWSNYRIGGQLGRGSAPAVVREGGLWWVFYHGADGALHQESLVNGGTEWADYLVGGSFKEATSPAAVHEGGAWWVFYQGSDSSLWQQSLVSGGGWGEYRIGGEL
jgi:hypothetical protein